MAESDMFVGNKMKAMDGIKQGNRHLENLIIFLSDKIVTEE